MNPSPILRSLANPSDWPAVLWLILAIVAVNLLGPLYRWFKHWRISGWTRVSGVIRSATFETDGMFIRAKGSSPIRARIEYTYFADGAEYQGEYLQQIESEYTATDMVRDLDGRMVEVRYNPSKPAKSVLTAAALAEVQAARAPAPPSRPEPIGVSSPILWSATYACVALTVVCFTLSIRSFFTVPMPPTEYFIGLFLGIFPVLIAASIVAARRYPAEQLGLPRPRRARRSIRPPADLPMWAHILVKTISIASTGLFFIAIVFQVSPRGAQRDWMPWGPFAAFEASMFAISASIFYSAARAESSALKCTQGHTLRDGTTFCPKCGQPAVTPPTQT